MSKENLSTVYLDNNATTELSQDAAAIVMDMVINNIYGNPSSSHQIGTRIMEIVHAARYGVALSLNCGIEEVIFTSGGTESNNIALRGTYSNHTDAANDIVISAGEHSSINNTVEAIANEGKIRFIPLKRDGTLDLDWADRLITEDTALVSVMLANNETGVIFPVKEVVKIAHSRGALVHCDAVQVYGKMPIDVRSLGVDLLSISGHKAHSLSGTGALYIRKGVLIHPIMTVADKKGRQEQEPKIILE
jgi:cysteine desulfurase